MPVGRLSTTPPPVNRYTFHGGKRDDVAVLAGVVRAGPPPAGLRRRLGNLEYVDSY